jgi:selenocysteine lyase/cysteine desulfurase
MSEQCCALDLALSPSPAMLDPSALRSHYQSFLTPGRILLTGHSHQAWPDAARAGMQQAFEDAARFCDDKWPAAFAAADAVRLAIASRIGASPSEIALDQNTHDLIVRFLSALDLRERPHLVTTTGEFHSLNRQLRRLDEEGLLPITWVPAQPTGTLAERLAAAIRPETAAVLTSTVLFETSSVVPNLPELISKARAQGTEVLLDAYHAFYALPFTLSSLGASDAFVVGGGYKYAQWGEGNCFLRVPPRRFRPVITGWFAGFGELEQKSAVAVSYGDTGAQAFAGSTYDPASHYRARAVIHFQREAGFTPEALRALSLAQTSQLLESLAGLEIVTPQLPERRGAFISLRVRDAAKVTQALRAKNVLVDNRGDLLRLGPAPYLTGDELAAGAREVRAAIEALT